MFLFSVYTKFVYFLTRRAIEILANVFLTHPHSLLAQVATPLVDPTLFLPIFNANV